MIKTLKDNHAVPFSSSFYIKIKKYCFMLNPCFVFVGPLNSTRQRRWRRKGARKWKRGGAKQDMGRQVLKVRHSDKPRRHRAAAQRDTNLHGGDHERLRLRLRHLRHPSQLRLVQLRPARQPPSIQAAPLRRLPRQRRQATGQRPNTLLPIRQHLPLPSLRLLC